MMSSASDDAEEETVTLEEHESSSVAIDRHVTVTGQPSMPEGQINIRESPYFSYNYFERQLSPVSKLDVFFVLK